MEKEEFSLDGILDETTDDHSDMLLSERIRFLLKEKTPSHLEIAKKLIREFPFWYGKNKKMVYWTENHYIMNTSNQYLLYLFVEESMPDEVIQRIDAFLDSRLVLGISEFYSPVYLPMTIGALLNLFDFTPKKIWKEKIKTLLDRISVDIMACALDTSDFLGGSLFCASARSYERHRESSTNNTINLWLQFLKYKQREPFIKDKGILSVVLPLTSYEPPIFSIPRGTERILLLTKPSFQVQEWIWKSPYTEDIKGSLLLSYGMYIPSLWRTIRLQIRFFKSFSLFDYPDFKSLGFLRHIPDCLTVSILKCLTSSILYKKARQSWLSDARLHIVRKERMVLTYLIKYHQGYPGAQQLVWALNLDTVPIYVDSKPNSPTSNNRPELIQNDLLPFLKFSEHQELEAIYKKTPLCCLSKEKVMIRYPKNDPSLEKKSLENGWISLRKNDSVVLIKQKRDSIKLLLL